MARSAQARSRAASGLSYAILVGLVAVVAIAAIVGAGASVNRLFGTVSTRLSGTAAAPSPDSGAGGFPTCAAARAAGQPTGLTSLQPGGSGATVAVWCDQDSDGGGWLLLTIVDVDDYDSGSPSWLDGFSNSANFSARVGTPENLSATVTSSQDWSRFRSQLSAPGAILRFTNSVNGTNRYERNFSLADWIDDAPFYGGGCGGDIIGGDGVGQVATSVTFASPLTARGNGFANDGLIRGPGCRGGTRSSSDVAAVYTFYEGDFVAGSVAYSPGSNARIFIWGR